MKRLLLAFMPEYPKLTSFIESAFLTSDYSVVADLEETVIVKVNLPGSVNNTFEIEKVVYLNPKEIVRYTTVESAIDEKEPVRIVAIFNSKVDTVTNEEREYRRQLKKLESMFGVSQRHTHNFSYEDVECSDGMHYFIDKYGEAYMKAYSKRNDRLDELYETIENLHKASSLKDDLISNLRKNEKVTAETLIKYEVEIKGLTEDVKILSAQIKLRPVTEYTKENGAVVWWEDPYCLEQDGPVFVGKLTDVLAPKDKMFWFSPLPQVDL